jgi:hypothetical protein
MTIQTICDRCGMEYKWAGVTVGDRVYCCAGCAAGGLCTCPVRAGDAVVVTDDTVLVSDSDVVVVE